MLNFYVIDKTNLIIIILGVFILFLFFAAIYKNIKKIKIKKEKVDKKKIYLCKIIGKREYVTKNNETYYYLKFLINDEEREFLVAKDKYDIFTEGMNGQLTLLRDKVFIDFTII